MLAELKRAAKRAVRAAGIDVVRYPPVQPPPTFPQDFTEDDIALCTKVQPFTVAGCIAIQTTATAVEYIVKNDIPGAIVECGVWRGGMMMAAADTLLKLGDTGRDIFLYDTFEGMPEPTDADVSFWGTRPSEYAEESRSLGKKWLHGSLEDVTSALYSVGYPRDKIHFVKGRVEDTIPRVAPERISFLRLDTCFYESTRHELVHLFPRLSPGGVLHIDDYGVWKGSRQAADEYTRQNQLNLFLTRIDHHGARIAIKPGESQLANSYKATAGHVKLIDAQRRRLRDRQG
jgi:O-methyltransferase